MISKLNTSACFAVLAFVASNSMAQAPAGAPAGATGQCKDGTYSENATKRGACAGHKGVQAWFAADAEPAKKAGDAKPATPAKPAPNSATPTAPAAAAPAVAPPSPAATSMAKTAPVAARTPASGGGAGQVWVNSSSKVYHCPGTKYYGTTKAGSYMSEADAKAAGNHADHGKACTS